MELTDGSLATLMVMLPYVLGTILAGCLYGVVLWRAGFRLAVALAPTPVVVPVIHGLVLESGLGGTTLAFSTIMVLLSLTPLLFLALAPWPRLQGGRG